MEKTVRTRYEPVRVEVATTAETRASDESEINKLTFQHH